MREVGRSPVQFADGRLCFDSTRQESCWFSKHVTASPVSCFSVAPGYVSKARLGGHVHKTVYAFIHKMHSLNISTIATV